jgi:hypothetical protein
VHISVQNIHLNKTRAIVAGTNKASAQQGEQAGLIDLPALIAIIVWAGTNRAKVHNKTGSIAVLISLFNEMSMGSMPMHIEEHGSML